MSGQSTRGGPSAWGLGKVLTYPYYKKLPCWLQAGWLVFDPEQGNRFFFWSWTREHIFLFIVLRLAVQFSGWQSLSNQGVKVSPHLHLAQRFRLNRLITALPHIKTCITIRLCRWALAHTCLCISMGINCVLFAILIFHYTINFCAARMV